MTEFEEDPDGFKLRGFPVHEGTEYHNEALEDISPNHFDVSSIMGMAEKAKPIIDGVTSMFGGGDKKDGTPPPNELGVKPNEGV